MFKRTQQNLATRYLAVLVAAMTLSNHAGAQDQHADEHDAQSHDPESFVANSGRPLMQITRMR